MSRTITLAGYAVLAVAVLTHQLVAILGRRTATIGQALEPVKRSLPGRLVLLGAWMWVGWHLFVRGRWG